MKIKRILITSTLIILTISFTFLFNLYRNTKTTIYDHYSYLYGIFDHNLNTLEENMNKTAIKDNNGWTTLKDANIDDKLKKETYNSLIKDINECYKYYISDKSIQKFKDKEEINIEELNEIKDINCINNFKKYATETLSENEKENIRLQTQISIMINYNEEELKNKTFETYLYLEVVRTNILLNLSRWLELEYNGTIN